MRRREHSKGHETNRSPDTAAFMLWDFSVLVWCSSLFVASNLLITRHVNNALGMLVIKQLVLAESFYLFLKRKGSFESH